MCRFRDRSGGSEKFNIVTVLKSENTNSVVIPNLRKATEYEFFLMPFYKMLEGQPSNSMNVQTLEDVPSAPPDNVMVEMLNSSSASVSLGLGVFSALCTTKTHDAQAIGSSTYKTAFTNQKISRG